MNERRTTGRVEDQDENRDPITGAPGAHPVGTGVGAASGGAAGAAIGTALGGPIGAGVGIVAGALIGGLAGKGAAEAIDPTAEDAYWREHYRDRDYVEANTDYETYRPAYQVGYEGYGRHQGRRFEEVEADLRRDYEHAAGRTGLAWEKAKHASRDAWQKLESPTGSKAPSRPTVTSNPANVSAQDTNAGESGCGCS